MTGTDFSSGELDTPRRVPELLSGPDSLRRLRHELRTPLTHILGYAELLLDEVAGAGHLLLAADLERISSSARTLLALVDDVIEGERHGRAAIDADRIDHQLRTLLTATSGYAELVADQLEQAGAGHLMADVDRIRVAAADLLGRVENALQYAGTAGEATAHSDVERPAPQEGQAIISRRGRHATGTLLVVDDDATNRELLSRRLTRLGYSVELVDNGSEALALMATRPFDLILLDVIMPEMTGYEVCQHIRAGEKTAALPVVLVTSLDPREEKIRGLECGADDFLTKPHNRLVLGARVRSLLKLKAATDALEDSLRRLRLERIDRPSF